MAGGFWIVVVVLGGAAVVIWLIERRRSPVAAARRRAREERSRDAADRAFTPVIEQDAWTPYLDRITEPAVRARALLTELGRTELEIVVLESRVAVGDLDDNALLSATIAYGHVFDEVLRGYARLAGTDPHALVRMRERHPARQVAATLLDRANRSGNTLPILGASFVDSVAFKLDEADGPLRGIVSGMPRDQAMVPVPGRYPQFTGDLPDPRLLGWHVACDLKLPPDVLGRMVLDTVHRTGDGGAMGEASRCFAGVYDSVLLAGLRHFGGDPRLLVPVTGHADVIRGLDLVLDAAGTRGEPPDAASGGFRTVLVERLDKAFDWIGPRVGVPAH